MACKILLTGTPGIGKTTVLRKIADELKQRGILVGGMITEEAREGNVRIGFKLRDISSGREGWLASTKGRQGPRIGKYVVDLEGLVEVGVRAIADALHDPKIAVVLIDELGPMELLSKEFKTTVKQSIASTKAVIGTIHYRATDPLLQEIRRAEDIKILVITMENRDDLHLKIIDELTQARLVKRNLSD